MNLSERSFKKSKNFTLILKQSGFSFYVLNSDLKEYPMLRDQKHLNILKTVAQHVQGKLHSMGFSKMGSPVLIGDLSDDVNQHTSRGTAGWASRTHIAIDYSYYMNKDVQSLVDTLYHEWAHRYLFQKSKEIKQNITRLHSEFIQKKFLEAIKHLDEKGGLEDLVDVNLFRYSGIVNKISSYFDSYFEPSQNGGQFLIQKMLQQNMFFSEFPKLVPHGVTIYSTLKDRNKTEIYAYHGNDGWIIGKKSDIIKPISQRNENVISEEDSYKIIENLDGKIKEYFKNKPPRVTEDLKSSVWEDIFLRIFRSLEITDKEFIDKQKHLADYVVEQMNNFNIDAYSQRELSKPYEIFWVSNEYKPSDLSLVSIIRKKKIKEYFLKLAKNPKTVLRYISMADGEKMRKIITDITNMSPESAGIFFGITEYGISSKDELWVNFLENLEKMPPKYRNQILKI